MRDAHRTATITGVGFALGSLEHATGLILLAFHIELFSGYPAWRHAVFTVVDASIAWVAMRRPDRLFLPLCAFLVEQVVTNGVRAWREWSTAHHVLWVVVVMHVLIFSATVAAGLNRRRATGRRGA